MMIETEEKSYFDLQNEKDENDIDYYNFFFQTKIHSHYQIIKKKMMIIYSLNRK